MVYKWWNYSEILMRVLVLSVSFQLQINRIFYQYNCLLRHCIIHCFKQVGNSPLDQVVTGPSFSVKSFTTLIPGNVCLGKTSFRPGKCFETEIKRSFQLEKCLAEDVYIIDTAKQKQFFCSQRFHSGKRQRRLNFCCC